MELNESGRTWRDAGAPRSTGEARMSILGSAIMLAQRGYAPHWLRVRSKAPIAEGWSTAPVATVTDLRQTYKPGFNLGVRCGHWSRPLPDHGLVIIDVDIRGPEAVEPALAAT